MPEVPKVSMSFTNSPINSAVGIVEGDLHINSAKTLAESAKEIQELLAQLNLNHKATNESEQKTLVVKIIEAIQKFPNLRDVIASGGIELIKLICPPLGIPIEMGKKLLEIAQQK